MPQGPGSLLAFLFQDRPPPPRGWAEGKGQITVVHEAVVTQAHAKCHRLLPRLAVTLERNRKGRVLGDPTSEGLSEAVKSPPGMEAPWGQESVSILGTVVLTERVNDYCEYTPQEK